MKLGISISIFTSNLSKVVKFQTPSNHLNQHKLFHRTLLSILTLIVLFALVNCKDEPTTPEEFQNVEPGINSVIHVDEGNVGIVIDARKIVKKGYHPTTATISFPSYSKFDTVLSIDASTNVAIFQIHKTRLSEAEQTDFNNGIMTDVVITDSSQFQLTAYHNDNLVIDASNTPLLLSTTLPRIFPDLNINENIPNLLQIEGSDSIITSFCSDCYTFGTYEVDNFHQQFYFIPVQSSGPNTFYIRHLGYAEGEYWYRESSQGWINLRGNGVPGDPEEFILEQEDDGWFRIKHKATGLYIYQDGNELRSGVDGDRFRLISDNIDWEIVDQGTVYHQPVMPPPQLDFAYSGTLRNCSSATLEENIGRSESRTRTVTVGSSESLQLFSQHQFSAGVNINYSVTAKVGVDIEGIGEAGEEVTKSIGLSFNYTYTTSQTSTSENNWSESTQTTEEVSRNRTITVPPFTVVEAYDAVKTVNDIIVPFTQKLRITAIDTESNTPLSGNEIVTQMMFNFASGVVSTVGSDYIIMTIRGHSTIDQLFEATTNVEEVENGCN